ncbi:MAG: FtsW/RodA/SpoVE family cell cycle protein [Phycisphaerae bacterium]|nr:FtsW/RodA/SpoVE family cell cycle protein [Phycisphaerae bacterium]
MVHKDSPKFSNGTPLPVDAFGMRAGHGIFLIALILLVFGVVMVNSAGLTVKPDPGLVTSGAMTQTQFEKLSAAYRPISMDNVLFGRTTVLAGIAILAMFIGSRVPVERLYQLRGLFSPVPWLLVAMVAMLLLVHVPGIGRSANNSARWIGSPQYGFQPSEMAKWGMLFVVAWHCCRRGGVMKSFLHGFVPPLIAIAVVCALIANEDLGTAVLIFTVSVFMLVAGGARWWHAGMLLPLGAIAAWGAIVASPYRMNRLLAWRNPFEEPQGIGYHIIQSMSAISGGGLFGRGLGNSMQKFGYLPEDTTDFIYAIICEELGVVGGLAVLLLYAGLLYLGLRVINRMRTGADGLAEPSVPHFSQLFGLGILLTIGLQALINITVVTGLAPTKGIALPLLSSGGSGWVLTAFSLGLLLSIERHSLRREAGVVETPPLNERAPLLLPAAT